MLDFCFALTSIADCNKSENKVKICQKMDIPFLKKIRINDVLEDRKHGEVKESKSQEES